MEDMAFVTVYRGLGGQSVSFSGISLTIIGLVQHLEDHTDWLWGIGKSYELRCGVTLDVIEWGYVIPTDTASEFILIYLPYRVTALGFPCWRCWQFVSWDGPKWYTRHRMIPFPPVLLGLLNLLLSRQSWQEFYEPRQYFCSACGLLETRFLSGIECVETDPITLRKRYASPDPFDRVYHLGFTQ